MAPRVRGCAPRIGTRTAVDSESNLAARDSLEILREGGSASQGGRAMDMIDQLH
jgi:hypothetical protein